MVHLLSLCILGKGRQSREESQIHEPDSQGRQTVFWDTIRRGGEIEDW